MSLRSFSCSRVKKKFLDLAFGFLLTGRNRLSLNMLSSHAVLSALFSSYTYMCSIIWQLLLSSVPSFTATSIRCHVVRPCAYLCHALEAMSFLPSCASFAHVCELELPGLGTVICARSSKAPRPEGILHLCGWSFTGCWAFPPGGTARPSPLCFRVVSFP